MFPTPRTPLPGVPNLNRLVCTIALSFLTLALAPAAEAAATKRVADKETTSVVKRTRVTRTYVAGRPHYVARQRSVVRLAPAKPSYGQLAGLHSTQDELDLKSSVALVIDQDSNEVLFRKNDSAVLPIASITKLMTGLIISESKLPMDEMITIAQDDVDTEKGSTSRLRVGT